MKSNPKGIDMRKLVSIFTLTAAAAAALLASTMNAPEASAAVCGYYQVTEDGGTDGSVEIPIFGTVNPFGGQRVVAHYGHCGPTNVRIRVDFAQGFSYACVTPGDSRLGQVNQGPLIRNAYYVGNC